jgi:predicted nucleic acid-binding protein
MKHYLPEVGTERVDGWFSSEPVAVSFITQVEVASTLARRTREGMLPADERDRIYQQFLDELSDMIMARDGHAVLERAADLARMSTASAPLRALDAIHLASSLVIFEAQPPEDGSQHVFVTADRQLQRAAEQAGLTVVDPEL